MLINDADCVSFISVYTEEVTSLHELHHFCFGYAFRRMMTSELVMSHFICKILLVMVILYEFYSSVLNPLIFSLSQHKQYIYIYTYILRLSIDLNI